MNNYIILDGYKYKTPFGAWKVRQRKPHSEKYTAGGNIDVTYGPATPYEWEGKILGPVTPEDASWGDIDDLRATVAKRQALPFTSHHGVSYTVHLFGPFTEESMSPVEDAPTNEFRVDCRIVKQS
jgi:hypothetical protein